MVGAGGVGTKALGAVVTVLRHPVVICLLITSVIAAAFVLYGIAHFGSAYGPENAEGARLCVGSGDGVYRGWYLAYGTEWRIE